MTRQEIAEKLRELLEMADPSITERHPVLQDSTRIQEDLGLNSVGMLYMAISMEEDFGISMADVDIWTLKTVGDVIDLILERKQ